MDFFLDLCGPPVLGIDKNRRDNRGHANPDQKNRQEHL
jgi:hypothetical protein